ncbi:DUF2141 domain-containing protein [Alkalicaulis satelles]|uniref:DUF2141 domain-containing protein n=1 Tax=Alkalicaulis satelles TaxID=2609175 RepID=A0A5M6ZA43_9PROT|nr:DUF2141 domain-containing protein [Alkalicaulis satelles]KAA5801562.1 DUF2141 domain-containing protein [Alkalicaulis satelles]
MKRIILASMAAMFGASAYAAPLTVTLDGVRWEGPLYISVQSEDQFMQEEAAASTMVQTPHPGAHNFTFDVPPGAYAVSVWHDDGNGVFDRDAYGRPLDGWAMSGEIGQGAPSFEDVAISVGPDGASVTLQMVYPD